MSVENKGFINEPSDNVREEPEERPDDMTSKIMARLESHGINLNTDEKDQHLLVSEKAVRDLVDSADITPQDVVLEIGPGPGQITEFLAQKADRVHTIEVDTRFYPLLEELKSKYSNINVEYGDALNMDWPRDITKFVANPPFSILESMLERFVKQKKLQTVSLVTGNKFYQRCFLSGDEFTRTSLITKVFFDVKLIEQLEKEDFNPPSREGSVIMRLDRKDKKRVDFGLRLFALRLINTPNASVKSILSDILSESLDVRNIMARGYENIPSIKSLGVPEQVLKRRLTDLNNKEINSVTRAIRTLKGKIR